MKLLRKAVNQTAYLKAGILGFAGSGKTYTSSEMAIGLAKQIGGKKPVAFFDTETGSDFLIPRFEKAGVELLVVKSRAFKDLLQFMQEAESECSVAIIDSISHVWAELQEAYKQKLKRKNGLYFQDWAELKSEWRQFTDAYLNAKVHAILCGRAGYEYDYDVNETGRRELIKTGTKMKAEAEMGYEPSLLLEMERVTKDEKLATGKRSAWTHRCYVLKDRTDRLNGKTIDNPKYADFKAVVDFLNVGGEHVGVDTTRTSEDLFDNPDYSYQALQKRREIAIEELQAVLIKAGLDGSSGQAKKDRVELLERIFGTSAKTAIEGLHPDDIMGGVERIKVECVAQSAPIAAPTNGAAEREVA